MASRDYYDILGVTRSASADEIRRAHRKLALQHHPDRSKAKDAPAKFAEIQQAYEVLSDEDKRKQYDEFVRLGGSPSAFGAHASSAGGAGAGGGGPFDGQGFGQGFGAQGFGGQARSGGSWNATDTQSFESIFGDIFGQSRGARSGRAQAGGRAKARGAQQMQYDAHVPLDLVLRGGKLSVTIEGERFDIDIPLGVDDEELVSVPGKLDALVRVHVAEHPWITRDERDLSFDLPISIVEATLGATIDAPLPAGGGTVALKIPPGTPSGKKLRISGRGFPASRGRAAGDLYVVIQIVPPKELSDLSTKLMQEVGRNIENPRARIAHLRS